MLQKKFEDEIMAQEPDEDVLDSAEVVVGTAGSDRDEIAGEDSHVLSLEDFEFDNVDLEELDNRNDGERAGFFYRRRTTRIRRQGLEPEWQLGSEDASIAEGGRWNREWGTPPGEARELWISQLVG